MEFRDFRFDVPESGPITFKIFFAPGTLPETWPDARQRKTRTSKAADPEPKAEEPTQDAMETPQEPTEPMAEEFPQEPMEPDENAIPAAEDNPEDEPLPEHMEVHYNVEGSARKALAHAIGDYTLDRHGVLTGPHNAQLLGLLAQDGYQTK